METFKEILDWLNTVAFFGLGLLTLRLWMVRRDRPSFWMLMTFANLGIIFVIGRVLSVTGNEVLPTVPTKILVGVLLLFPLFLYLLSTSFEPGRPNSVWLASALTAVVIAWTFVLSHFPTAGEQRSQSIELYIIAVVIHSTALSALVAWRFWRAGRDQPPVARARMRMLAAAATVLSIAIVISGGAPGDRAVAVDVVIGILTLLSAVTFYFAFSPPSLVRAAWRRPGEEQMRKAVLELLSAVTDEAVIEGLLPNAARLIGAEGIALLDKDGAVLGVHGIDRSQWEKELLQQNTDGSPTTRLAPDLQKMDFSFGSLIVRTNPYTPFFGNDEVALLGAFGVMANFALERVRASEVRLELAEQQMRRRQALEINDNVVQGLAVAKYAFDLGDTDKARKAVEGTLAAARRIITDLLEEMGDEIIFGPNALTRKEAATGFVTRDL